MATILICDNLQERRIRLRVNLQRLGHSVEESETGEDAWSVLQGTLPDLVIAQGLMAKMNGYDLLSLMKGREDTGNVPVILFHESQSLGDEDEKLRANYRIWEYDLPGGTVKFFPRIYNWLELAPIVSALLEDEST